MFNILKRKASRQSSMPSISSSQLATSQTYSSPLSSPSHQSQVSEPAADTSKPISVRSTSMPSLGAEATKSIETMLFGQPLPEELPQFVSDTMKHIEEYGFYTEAIFRSAASLTQVESMVRQIEQGKELDFRLYDVHASADLLKRYFRELPEPLLTFDHYDMILAAVTIPEYVERAKLLRKILNQFLPKRNYCVVRTLCHFLFRIKECSHMNHMTADSLAVQFASNLLRPRTRSSNSPLELLKDAKISGDLLKMLIEEYEFYFENGTTLLLASEWDHQDLASQRRRDSDGEEPGRVVDGGMKSIESDMGDLSISSTPPPQIPRRIIRHRKTVRKSRYDLVKAFERDFETRKRPIFHVTSHNSNVCSSSADNINKKSNKMPSKKFRMFKREKK